MFGYDFFPTPLPVIETMLEDISLTGKTVLEPSAGKGNIVDYLLSNGAEVIACEKDADLRKILATKCPVIADDFLKLESHQISHVSLIVMNPPFSKDEQHILHAWKIAPPACQIIALCNENTLENDRYRSRKELIALVESNGTSQTLGQCFTTAERKTDVSVSMIRLTKPGASYETEFEGFFMGEDAPEQQANALMPYNFIRDLVNRYVAAVKIYDEQLDAACRMNALTSQFYGSSVAMSVTQDDKPKKRGEFKKDLQKAAWKFIFNKMDMQRIATRGLQEDINKFVEQQTHIPFTMRNIYRMLEIVIATTDQRMDKALLEVFDSVTERYSENRYNLEGWKTNSHYLLNRKFILPHVVEMNYRGSLRTNYHGWADSVNDLHTALRFITGTPYEGGYNDFSAFLDRNNVRPGEFHTWGFFDFRAYKKGTVHFTFQDEEVWALFNQRIAKIKGYPLPESIKNKAPKQEAPSPKFQAPNSRKQPEAAVPELVEGVEVDDIPKYSPDVELDETPDTELVEVYDPNQLSIFEAIYEFAKN